MIISNRQMQILTFIDDYIQENGYSPTVREIRDGVGLYSSSTVHNHISILKEKGYIEKVESAPRTIRVLKR